MNSRAQLFDVRRGGGGGNSRAMFTATTVRQITSSYNRDDQGNLSTHTVHRSLLRAGLNSR